MKEDTTLDEINDERMAWKAKGEIDVWTWLKVVDDKGDHMDTSWKWELDSKKTKQNNIVHAQ